MVGCRLLAISNEPSRYTPLESWAYEWRSARRLAPGLWQLHQDDDGSCLDGTQELLEPLVRSLSFEGLLAGAAGARLPPRWNLRYTTHARDGRRAAPFRAGGRPTRDAGPASSDILCVAAAALPGSPSLGAAEPLLLVQTPRLWYLALALGRARTAIARRSAALDVWRGRPYSFSAATHLQLARLAVSLACAHHVRSGKRLRDGALLDPCCGSGTLLYAARLAGLNAVGFDLNPKAVEGAESNMRYLCESEHAGLMDDCVDSPCAAVAAKCAPLDIGAPAKPDAQGGAPGDALQTTKVAHRTTEVAHETTEIAPRTTEMAPQTTEIAPRTTEVSLHTTDVAPQTTRVFLHDCTSGPPPVSAISSVCLVVASLPWGRNQRIPHAGYLSALLQPLALALPNATFCLVSSAPFDSDALSQARLVLHRSQTLGTRCVLSVLTPQPAQPPLPVPLENKALSRRRDVPDPQHASNPQQRADSSPQHSSTLPQRGASAKQHVSTSPQPNASELVEVIGGGGLRSGGRRPRMPSEGDVIEVQCRRPNGGRAWFAGTVVRSTRASSMPGAAPVQREGELVTCRVEWHTVQSQSRQPVSGLPEELGLGMYDGPNWRFFID
jgi:hypothetical protein